jgi:2-polyprenyl-6-hydroxyphenyl methylase/3-demethylubiquinone-9 3-methyltransferase
MRPSSGLTCIACDGHELTSLGRLPVYTSDFLGRDLDSGIDPGTLYECANCALRFRAPQPTEDELLKYYQGMDVAECWQHGSEREVWRYIKEEVQGAPARSVLDVGCFRGDLLSYLGDGFDRFGVEPSHEAAREAGRRGVTLIADRIESMSDDGPRFGAITLIDVAEHLPRPVESLALLTRLLIPGGKLIIFTGSTDALSWRLAGLNYYYSAMPEHVAFMRPSWFNWVAPRIGCEVTSIRRLRYQPVSWRKRVDESLKNLSYIAYQQLRRSPFMSKILSHIPVVRRVGQWQGSWWTSAKDHILVVLTRPLNHN